MLKMMRHHAKYFYILFFLVIISFVFWGVGSIDKTSNADVVAEVGKYKILKDEYWRAYDRAFKFYREIYKEKFDEEMQEKLKLKEKILDTLIGNRVLLIAAKEFGIEVNNDEVSEAIVNDPAFMRNGVFDREIYQNTLRLSRITPEYFENLKRQELTVKKMSRLIELSAPTVYIPPVSSTEEQVLNAIKETMASNAKEQAVRSYIEGYKKNLKIKVYKQLIS